MAKISNFHEIVYETPSYSAYNCRKTFHGIQRQQNENIEVWFCRIQSAIDGCDFGRLSNFLLIDKFISGLNDGTFERFSQTTTLSVDQLFSTVTSVEAVEDDSFTESKFLPTEDTSELLSAVLNTNEIDYERHSFSENEENPQFDEKEHKNDILQDRPNIEETPTINETKETNFDTQLNAENAQSNFSKTFKNDQQISLKIKGFKIDAKKRVECLDCGKTFKGKVQYNRHKRIHTGKNLHKCKTCDKLYTSHSSMVKHRLSHRHDGRKFVCHLCSFEFQQLFALRRHFQLSHMPVIRKELHCTLCEKVLFSQNALDQHLKAHVGFIAMHQCPHCDKRFDRPYNLKAHLTSHSDFKEFICECCGEAFKTREQLKRHSRRRHAHTASYNCTECDQVLKTPVTLRNHMKIHTGERRYKCNFDSCQKKFANQSGLLRHLNVHKGLKPIACTICPKRFATPYHMKLHLSVHTGAKPYKCQHCDRGFTQPGTMKVHIQRFHPN